MAEREQGQERFPSRWPTLLLWVLAHMAGGYIGGRLSQFIVAVIWLFSGSDWARNEATALASSLFTSLLVGGLLVGVGQWLVLRPWTFPSTRWMWATTGGVVIGATLAAIAACPTAGIIASAYNNNDVATMVLLGALVSCPFGFALGIAQWWVLRGWVQRAGLWVLATTLGWTIGGTTNNVPLAAIVAGGMTGLALIYLLRNPSNAAASEQKDAVDDTPQRDGS